MTRRFANFLTAAALLLCAAVLFSWVTSFLPEQFHFRSHKGRLLLVFAAKHHAHLFDESSRDIPLDDAVQSVYAYTAGEPGATHFRFAGFEIALTDRTYGVWFFAVPHWALALPLGAASGWGLWAARRRRRRAAAGQCLRCGYDLRASGGRCPECGTPALGIVDCSQPGQARA
jgi:hypothetical protein